VDEAQRRASIDSTTNSLDRLHCGLPLRKPPRGMSGA